MARPLVVLCAAQTPVAVAQPGEDGLHAVVVALENGIELVIVTTRAADGEPEQALAHGADDFVKFILPSRAHGLLVTANLPGQIRRAGDEKTQRRIRAGDVAGQLIAKKLVVWQIGIERVNDPVAVMPCLGPLAVGFKPHRLRPADDIQPMLRPALAVPRRGQKPVDHLHECLVRGTCIPRKRPHLRRRWRQAGEVERHAPEQSDAISLGRISEFLFAQFLEDKKIDGVRLPRNDRTLHRLQRPVRLRSHRCGGDKTQQEK